MGTKKPTLTVILLLILLSIHSQSENIDIVKRYYPQIYTSIKTEAEKQWANDPKVSNAIMEGQAKAFLQIAESKEQIDPVAMGDALLYGSITNEEEYNKTILNDLRVENPYTLLRCNWSVVRAQYEKTKSTKLPYNDPVIDNQKISKPVNIDKYQDEIYGNKRSYKKKTANSSSAKYREFYDAGASLDLIYSNITNLGEWDKDANPGGGLELRFWGRQRFGKSFLVMSESSMSYIHHSVKDYSTNEIGNLDQFYIKLNLMLGIYRDLSSNTTLIIGGGLWGGVNFCGMTVDILRDEENIYPSSEDLGLFNYGFSGIAGIQYKRYEFSLRGNWGMADLNQDGYNFKSRTIALSIGLLFNCW